MGIAIGTTITVTFDAQQIAQLDCLLQEIHSSAWEEKDEHDKKVIERINNVWSALTKAGYR